MISFWQNDMSRFQMKQMLMVVIRERSESIQFHPWRRGNPPMWCHWLQATDCVLKDGLCDGRIRVVIRVMAWWRYRHIAMPGQMRLLTILTVISHHMTLRNKRVVEDTKGY
jgi:hypothetical protein